MNDELIFLSYINLLLVAGKMMCMGPDHVEKLYSVRRTYYVIIHPPIASPRRCNFFENDHNQSIWRLLLNDLSLYITM